MKTDKDRIRNGYRVLAKAHALSNAAELIRGLNENGLTYRDKRYNRASLRENKSLAKQLDRRARKYFKQYEALNIEIDTEEI